MPPGVVVNDPRESGAHGRKSKPISGGYDSESKAAFSWREPSLNHGEHRGPHACGTNTHNSVEEAGGPKLVDGAHKKNADAEDEAAGGDNTPCAQSVGEVAAEGSDRNVGKEIGIVDGSG